MHHVLEPGLAKLCKWRGGFSGKPENLECVHQGYSKSTDSRRRENRARSSGNAHRQVIWLVFVMGVVAMPWRFC